MGDLLEKLLTDLNIVPKLHRHETIPTGTCACVIVNKERSLCANLAACLKYPTEHVIA